MDPTDSYLPECCGEITQICELVSRALTAPDSQSVEPGPPVDVHPGLLVFLQPGPPEVLLSARQPCLRGGDGAPAIVTPQHSSLLWLQKSQLTLDNQHRKSQ
ncbi:olfactory receptor [Sarotherodon galilaeus]